MTQPTYWLETGSGPGAEVPAIQPRPSIADLRFMDYLRDAERGQLGPADFTQLEALLPYVSAELRAPFGPEQ